MDTYKPGLFGPRPGSEKKKASTPRSLRHLNSAQFPVIHSSEEVAPLIMANPESATLPRGDNKTGEIPKQGGQTSAGG
jgi:hypothetical protein